MTTTTAPAFTFTRHATTRLLDMAVEPAEIQRVLTRGRYRPHGTERDREYLTIGRLTLVVTIPDEQGCRGVVTALWSSQHDWRCDQTKGSYKGRSDIRDNSNLRRKRR